LAIGDSIAEDAEVKTAMNSTCEIQFGHASIIHIAENTALALRTVEVSDAHATVDLELSVGSVTAKVAKLADKDHFQIRTDAVVCGVRGTKFNVEKRANDTTAVAVAEGTVVLLPTSFNPVSLEKTSSSPAQGALVAEADEKVAEHSPVVGANSEVVVTKASMTKADVAATQLAAVLAAASGTAGPSVEKAPASSVAQTLDSYLLAVSTLSELAPKPLEASVQQHFHQTANLQILETLPAAPQSRPNPRTTPPPSAPCMPLAIPKAITPAPDAQLDINKTDSIQFSWQAVPHAALYRVDVLRISGETKTLIRSFTTSALSIVFDQLAILDLGTFSWEVTALPYDSDKEFERSAPAVSSFKIIKTGILPAPSINKLPAPVIRLPGSPNSGSTR
jgi:hypothetical protein